jgi:lysozyme family protein
MQKYIDIANANQAEFEFFLEKVFPITMKWEGGGKLHNVAGDSGGWTIYGIAWNYNKEYFEDFEAFKNISEEHAAMFAFANYYLKLSPSYLKSNAKLIAFDIAYNMGVGKAIQYIQECAGVTADGKIGPNTRSKMGNVTPDCLQQKRVAYYNALNKQTKFQKFYKGWMNRANDIFKITKTN